MKKRLPVLLLCVLFAVIAVAAIALFSCDDKSPYELEIEKYLAIAQDETKSIKERGIAFYRLKDDHPDILHKYALDVHKSPKLRSEAIEHVKNQEILIQIVSNFLEYPTPRRVAFSNLKSKDKDFWIEWILLSAFEDTEMRVWAGRLCKDSDLLFSIAMDPEEDVAVRIATIENEYLDLGEAFHTLDLVRIFNDEEENLTLRGVILRRLHSNEALLIHTITDPTKPDFLRGVAISNLDPRNYEDILVSIAEDEEYSPQLRALAISRFSSHHPQRMNPSVFSIYH